MLKPNEAFPGTWGQRLLRRYAFVPHLDVYGEWICLLPHLGYVQPHPSGVPPTLVRPPRAHTCGSGFLTGFPSPTPFGLGLGTDLPCADRLDAGNLRLTARGVLTRVIATYADRVDSIRSTRPSGAASRQNGTLAYHRSSITARGSEASVRGLSPVVLSVQGRLTSELLRFL
jgi:hypothetical protein